MTSVAPWWLALVIASGIAGVAWRLGSLQLSGMVASTAIGLLALRVQWGWGAFLISWFVLASVLSRIGATHKSARISRIVAKGERRDVLQVLANGGVFAASALLVLLFTSTDPARRELLAIVAAGSLAAAGADTWSTEIGTWLGGSPWSIRDRQRVAPGTSGAITASGTIGGVVGAIVLAMLACAAQMIPSSRVGVVAFGGVCGVVADTVAGAWLQERRWCDHCGEWTERAVHSCGTATDARAGVRGIDNDAVNFVCAVIGGVTAAGLAALS